MNFLEYFVGQALADNSAISSIEPFATNGGNIKQLDQFVAASSLQAMYVAAIALGLLIFIAVVLRNPSESSKRVLFWSISAIVFIATGVMVTLTVYLNQVSVTNGPVHWHADFEIWACGQKQDLLDPTGIYNKIGTPTLHEHNDLRIHVEGVVVDYPEVDFGSFFQVIGGELTSDTLTIPTNAGKKSFISGRDCPDSGSPAELQVFAVTADLQNRTYSQQKLTNPATYQFAQHSQVPPGDCLIVEYDLPKNRTDKLCQSYVVAKATGEISAEVPLQEEDGH